jgi:hypothetical protein
MGKPRIFLGSSGNQEKLLQALTRGLEDVAHVEPWTNLHPPCERREASERSPRPRAYGTAKRRPLPR